jgi:cyclopropane-fatty-acyl-phospholipid synthase
MSFISLVSGAAERVPLPDLVVRVLIRELCARSASRLAIGGAANDAAFARALVSRPIAAPGAAAHSRHYELPAAFFAEVLGPNRKSSCGFYKEPVSTLQEAEEEALRRTVANADLANGQTILELGCGWGSLSLSMARQFPRAQVTAVSNSQAQRRYIEGEAAARGLTNLSVVTSDMTLFAPAMRFDRIVSVEMFEHIMNWRALLMQVRSWLAPEGRFFMHVFAHRAGAYLFDRADRTDWIAQHFLAGNLMPSHGLIGQYGDLFAVEKEWRWSGTHYQRTALAWLANFDAHRDRIMAILLPVYGAETQVWMRRWRWFFLAAAGLFGFDSGSEWGVSQYRMAAV